MEPHLAFLPGLFHDVGRIAFLLAADDAFAALHDHAGANAGSSRCDVERAWYGFDHAEAAAILVEDWGLASEQVEGIRWHHQPGQAERGRALAAVLNVADAGAYELGCGSGGATPVDAAGCEYLGLAPEAKARAITRARAMFAAHHDVLG